MRARDALPITPATPGAPSATISEEDTEPDADRGTSMRT
jgi:hypothetical protein